jgi:hypothetical protein
MSNRVLGTYFNAENLKKSTTKTYLQTVKID